MNDTPRDFPLHHAANSGSSLVLHFISVFVESVNRGEHLAEGHNGRETRHSVKRHQEPFTRGINLLFNAFREEGGSSAALLNSPLSLSLLRHLGFADSVLPGPGRGSSEQLAAGKLPLAQANPALCRFRELQMHSRGLV